MKALKETDKEKKENTDKKKRMTDVSRLTGNRLTAMCGVFMALAMILSYMESLLPVFYMVPGIKLGLANMVTIVALYRLGLKPALIISVGRILLSGILFGNIMVILYSLAGGILSIFVMLIARRIRVFTVTGVSICGAVAHNLGQIAVAAIVLENANIMYYMTVLAISGGIAGAVIGIMAGVVMKNLL